MKGHIDMWRAHFRFNALWQKKVYVHQMDMDVSHLEGNAGKFSVCISSISDSYAFHKMSVSKDLHFLMQV